MELKELVLSTLEELDRKLQEEHTATKPAETVPEEVADEEHRAVHERHESESQEEIRFLEHTRERLCLLFEGLQQASGDRQAKLDMTLKYLQYHLAAIEERLTSLQQD